MPVPEVYVAAGSNVRPRTQLRRALAALAANWPGLRISRAFANSAFGFEGADFINLAAGFATDESPERVLERLRAVEAACDRPRDAPKWAPRTLDLDLLLYGDLVGQLPGATLPRPDLLRRAYMLGPLADIAPDLCHPVAGETIAALWQRFDRGAHPLHEVRLEEDD
ncbi:MAG: 2-amino-4-hydroxy-6-hydroxymethyldihydropteridine diphosphokinase [Gammaproteobacteria bacterium]|jgi:2-amino-4-hydroxy-6-hydroxymethyldihydropteridine diphosphokinase|nr:MAG: 2-amino-4-hydroxy-6-hydroxymethyldihydropteridine diphosphokinase [Gammaproteobacteria bacterium]